MFIPVLSLFFVSFLYFLLIRELLQENTHNTTTSNLHFHVESETSKIKVPGPEVKMAILTSVFELYKELRT